MTNERINRLTISPDFVGLLDGSELEALFNTLIVADGLEPLLWRCEGKFLRCCGFEEFRDSSGPGVRVKHVVFVQNGKILIGENLSVNVPSGTSALFLHSAPNQLPLHDGSGYISRINGGVFLSTNPFEKAHHGVEFIRLKRSSESDCEINPLWWPDVSQIGSDIRSVEAAEELVRLLPTSTPEMTYLSKRIQLLDWPSLLPTVLRHLTDTFASRPGIRGKLSRIVEASDDATVVGHLIEFLRADSCWPNQIREMQFAMTIAPSSYLDHNGSNEYVFSIPETRTFQNGEKLHLAVQVEVEVGDVCEVSLKTESGDFRRPVKHLESGILGEVVQQQRVEVAIKGGHLVECRALTQYRGNSLRASRDLEERLTQVGLV